MSTKVFIVDLDLGSSVEDIVQDEVQKITGEARRILDTAIEQQKTLQETKERKEAEKKITTNIVTRVMKEAYEQLVEAGEIGIPVNVMISNVSPTIPNSSAFTMRMRNILKSKGNPYRLVRKQHNQTPTYFFEPFNESFDDS